MCPWDYGQRDTAEPQGSLFARWILASRLLKSRDWACFVRLRRPRHRGAPQMMRATLPPRMLLDMSAIGCNRVAVHGHADA
jgi:hypothetical protein